MRSILKKITLIAGIGLVIFGSLATLGSSGSVLDSHCWSYAFGLSPDPRSLCGPAYGWFILGMVFVIGGGFLIGFSRITNS